jgi:negative regulator of sigma-B (phosphoserine phosphatase)
VLESGRVGPLEWAVTGKPLVGEQISGDDWVIAEFAGHALIAVVDGLGHGEAAAVAAQRALRVAARNAAEPLDRLLTMCHEALEGTRGGAMTLARIDVDTGSLEWLGIGNVGAYLIRVSTTGSMVAEAAMLRGGILGHTLPSLLKVRDTAMLPGDLLLMGTDGLGVGFEDTVDLSMPTTHLVVDLLDRCAKDTDDALVLAARNRGPSR